MNITSSFESFSKDANLDIALPNAPDFDLEVLLKDGKPEQIATTPARRNLFFDEQANVLVILSTSASEEDTRSLLPDMDLVLGAHVTDAVPQGGGTAASASGKHDLGYQSFQCSNCTNIVTSGDKVYVIWKLVLHLSRPRARLQRPAIYFTASISLKSSNRSHTSSQSNAEILQSFQPLPANVLEPLQFDPALRDSSVYLAESRITKVAPKAPSLRSGLKPIRGTSKRAFPAVPALFSNIKFSGMQNALVASVHLETSHVISGTVTVEQVELETPHAKIDHLTDVNLPLDTNAGDESILLYRISPNIEADLPTHRDTPILATVTAHATLEQGSRIALELKWQTHVNLDQATPKVLYRWSRPLNTPAGHHRGLSTQSNPVLPSETQRELNESDSGIAFTFSAEGTTIQGSNFALHVLCNNRSGRQRRFALLMVPPRKPRLLPQATEKDADLVASIFNRPQLERTKPPDVLELSSDVRIGPIPAGARYETLLKFKALSSGVLDLGILRILDLDTRQMVDVRDLPDIVSSAQAG